MAAQFRSIQALRGVAAIAVTLSHLLIIEGKSTLGAQLLPGAFAHGTSGVDLFFVISGFIITVVSKELFEKPGSTARFLLHRAIRIYPVYWIYFFLLLGVYLIDSSVVNSSYGAPNLLKSFLLVPDRNPPLLAVAWTLNFEVFFYIVFAFAIRFLEARQLVPVLLVWAAVTVAGAIVLQLSPDQPVLGLIFSPLILEFIAGSLIACIMQYLNRTRSLCFLSVGVLFFLVGTAAIDNAVMPPLGGWREVLIYGVGSVSLVAALVGLERCQALPKIPRFVLWVGDASYSLYLSHVLTLSAVGRIWYRFLASQSAINHIAFLTIAFILALAWALSTHRLLEAPLLHYLKTVADRLPQRIREVRASGTAVQ